MINPSNCLRREIQVGEEGWCPQYRWARKGAFLEYRMMFGRTPDWEDDDSVEAWLIICKEKREKHGLVVYPDLPTPVATPETSEYSEGSTDDYA